MTILPSKAERDAIGIDTYERAILYAAVMLRRSFLIDGEKQNLKRLSITLAQSREKNTIEIQGDFPYANSYAWERGGDAFKSVWYLSLSDPSNAFAPPSNLVPLQSPYISIRQEPAWVETLEEFFIWLLSETKASLHLESPPRTDLVSYRIFDSRTPDPVIEFKVSLPFNISRWLLDRHFFNSLLPVLTESPAIQGRDLNQFSFISRVNSQSFLLKIYRITTALKLTSQIESEGNYLRSYRNFSSFITASSVTSVGVRVVKESSEFTARSVVNSWREINKLSKLRYSSSIETLTSKANPTTDEALIENRTIIQSSEEVRGSLTLSGRWGAFTEITIKPDFVYGNHQEFPVFVHIDDLQHILSVNNGKDLVVKSKTGDLLPLFKSSNDFPFTNNQGIWFLAPHLNKDFESTFYLYFLDQDSSAIDTNTEDGDQVFKNYHVVILPSIHTENTIDYINVITNQTNLTLVSSYDDLLYDDNTLKTQFFIPNQFHPFFTNQEKRNHPDGYEVIDLTSLVIKGTFTKNSSPIAIDENNNTPTLQIWQDDDDINIIKYGNLQFSNSDTASIFNSGHWRKYSLNQDGAFLNDTFNNPRTINPEPIGSSPELALGDPTSSNNRKFAYIKLAKHKLSFDWIRTEYHNERNRSSFYSIGNINYISVFHNKTTIESNEIINKFYIFVSSRDYNLYKLNYSPTNPIIKNTINPSNNQLTHLKSKDSNIYAYSSVSKDLVKYDKEFNELSRITQGSVEDFIIDNNGNVFFGIIYHRLVKYDNQGNKVYTTDTDGVGTATCLAFLQNGNIIMGNDDGKARIFNPNDGTMLQKTTLSNSFISGIEVDFNGNILAIMDNKLKQYSSQLNLIWQLTTANQNNDIKIDDNNNIYVGGQFSIISKYDNQGNLLWSNNNIPQNDPVTIYLVNNNVVLAVVDNRLVSLNTNNGTIINIIEIGNNELTGVTVT